MLISTRMGLGNTEVIPTDQARRGGMQGTRVQCGLFSRQPARARLMLQACRAVASRLCVLALSLAVAVLTQQLAATEDDPQPVEPPAPTDRDTPTEPAVYAPVSQTLITKRSVLLVGDTQSTPQAIIIWLHAAGVSAGTDAEWWSRAPLISMPVVVLSGRGRQCLA